MKNLVAEKIVAFKIGTGGRFNSPGHLSYIGEYEIGDFIDDLFLVKRDEKGKFCKPFFVTFTGRVVGLTWDDVKTGIGRIDCDGKYDTIYAKRLKDCTDEELSLIFNKRDEVSPDVRDFILSYFDM